MLKMAKTSTNCRKDDDAETVDSPRILVIRRGFVSSEIKELAKNLRFVFSPNCAISLKEGSKQRLRDFTTVTDVLGLTHLVTLSESNISSYIKIISLPNGPTITFSIDKLSLISDIAKQFKNPHSFGKFGKYPPLLVLDGFSCRKRDENDEDITNIISSTLNSMFTPIDLSTTKMQNCRRVLLFHRESGSDDMTLRHYSINLIDCCTTDLVKDLVDKRTMKKIIGNDNIQFKDIIGRNTSSDNFNEDLDEIIELNKLSPLDIINRYKYGIKDNPSTDGSDENPNKVAIRLIEIGPRLCLKAIKIEEGVQCGRVKFHKYVKKTQDDLEENEKMEPEIIQKRKLESERVEKIYKRYTKNK